MPNSSAVERNKRSAIDRSALTSPGEETNTRIIFIALRERRRPLNPAFQTLAAHQPGSPLSRYPQFSQIVTISAKGIFTPTVERCLACEADRSDSPKQSVVSVSVLSRRRLRRRKSVFPVAMVDEPFITEY
jgi:hypothetical protein